MIRQSYIANQQLHYTCGPKIIILHADSDVNLSYNEMHGNHQAHVSIGRVRGQLRNKELLEITCNDGHEQSDSMFRLLYNDLKRSLN